MAQLKGDMTGLKGDKEIQELKSALYLKVQTIEDVRKLRQCLEKCAKNELLSWIDNDGYDILHHAIMSSNIETMGIMFAHGLFKPPHEPKFHPYLHVAANLGNKAIVAMLLQERPGDYSEKKTKYKWVKLPTEVPSLTPGKISCATPLDVAGDSGHLGCVKTILDFYSLRNRVETGYENYLCTACTGNSPSALRLLLKQKPADEDMKAAVGAALKLANAECLDVLLRCSPKLTSLFSGMNLYHVLYSYSLSFKKEWYEYLLTVTSVLLKHKQNPLSSVPFRTYPLYSLLSHTPASDFGRTSPYLIACMVVLLNAGVDPNFNELLFETEHESLNIQTAFGRSAYSSAFHCLFDTVAALLKQCPDDIVSIRRFVTKCTETLLKHSADPNITGPIDDEGHTGNALHAFLKVSMVLGLDERSITTFRLLIQNGTNPNLCSDGYYAINIFIDQILLKLTDVKYKGSSENVLMEYIKEIVCSLLDRMTPECVKQAAGVKFDGKPVNPLQKKILKYTKEQLNTRALSVWSLKVLCKVLILELCKRKPMAVVQLPIPTQLKRFVNGVEEMDAEDKE